MCGCPNSAAVPRFNGQQAGRWPRGGPHDTPRGEVMATGQKKASKGADSASSAADTATDAADTATETAQDAGESAKGGSNGLLSELGGTAREAALAVLKPAVKNAAETAAKYAV